MSAKKIKKQKDAAALKVLAVHQVRLTEQVNELTRQHNEILKRLQKLEAP